MRTNWTAGIRWIALFALILAFAAGAAPVYADTLCVDPAGANGCAYTTIQAAIDAAADGDVINVYPGDYDETAADRTVAGLEGALYTFGLYIDKPLTLQGVDASGAPITDYADVAAHIATNSTSNFGPSGVWVQGDGVVISGLDFVGNHGNDNKTLEVIGDNFTLQNSKISVPDGWGSVYINDFRFDDSAGVSHVQTYQILNNYFVGGNSLDIASGAGYTGPAAGRVISGNKFEGGAGVDWALVSFNGFGTTIPWYTDPVGGAVIENNEFSGSTQYIRLRGTLADNPGFDFAAYFDNNTFDKSVAAWTPGGEIRSYEYVSSYGNFPACGIGSDIQAEINHAAAGDTVEVGPGTYVLSSLVTINKDVTLTGAGVDLTKFQVSGTGHRISMTADGATLQDVEIEKTDKTGGQNIIYLAASNLTLQNLSVHGQWLMGEGEVSRAIEATGGKVNITIQDSEFYGLRQPGYLNTSQFNILNNYVDGTRGWVLEGANVTFTGNTWGANAVDIAILSVTNPAYYPDLLAISAANNNAVIEDQRTAPFTLTHVWVNDDAPLGGNGYEIGPFQSVQSGINAVVPGGYVYVAAGTYNEAVTITKAGVQLLGAGRDVTTIVGPKTAAQTMLLRTNGTVVDGFTITRAGNNVAEWNTNANNTGVAFFLTANTTLRNCTVTGNRNGVYFNDTIPPSSTFGNLVQGNIITNNRTGVNIFNGGTGNQFIDNEISNNWTHGVVFVQPAGYVAKDFTFRHNRIFGNWVTQVYNRNSNDPLDDPIDFEENWFGTSNVDFNTVLVSEPSYDSQIPVVFGGTAVAPGAPYPYTISDPVAGFSTLDYSPYCLDAACTQLAEANQLENGQTAILNTDGDGDNEIEATYAGTGAITVNLWAYDENPQPHSSLPAFIAPGVFYDIQVFNVTDPTATLTAVFEIETGKVLRFWDGSKWMVVRSNDGSIAKAVDNHLTVVFGPTSTPKLTELTGTPVASTAPEAAEVQIVPTQVQRTNQFSADIVAKSTGMVGVEVHLTYDPAALTLVSFTPAASLPLGFSWSDTATPGKIGFAHTVLNEGVLMSGDEITLATVVFEAKVDAPLGLTPVAFDPATPSIFVAPDFFPLATFPGALDAINDSITITAETELHGMVSLQGRPIGGSTFAGVLVSADGAVTDASDTTDANGFYDLLGLDLGVYSLTATFDRYLPAAWTGLNLGSFSYSVPAVTLLGGNAVYADTVINDSDLSFMGAQFLGSPTVVGFDDRNADINGDTIVNILDLAMGGVNYFKTSSPWTGAWNPVLVP